MHRPPSFFALSMSALNLALEAQAVVGLRLAQFATGQGSARESLRMVTEKTAALTRAHQAAAMALATEGPIVATERVLRIYRRAVAANRRRLS